MEKYKEWLCERKRSEHTIMNYVFVAQFFQEWFLERLNIDSFNPSHVSSEVLHDWKTFLLNEATYTRLLDTGNLPKHKRYSISSVQTFIKSIRTYFEFLKDTGVIGSNPAADLHPPKVESDHNDELRWLKKREKKQLIQFMVDPELKRKNEWKFTRNKAIIFVGLFAGLRRSEMVHLQTDHISFMNASLEVNDGEKTRIIPMNDELLLALKDWLDVRGEQEHPYVFTSQRGGMLLDNAIWRLCETIAIKTKISNFTPSTLRHTYARDLVMNGYKLKDIAYLLGHTNLNFTRAYKRSGTVNKKQSLNSKAEQ
jgi:site-specific recombinase XerD